MLTNFDNLTLQLSNAYTNKIVQLAELMYDCLQQVDYDPYRADFHHADEDIKQEYYLMAVRTLTGFSDMPITDPEF